jgi:hypothetical protein
VLTGFEDVGETGFDLEGLEIFGGHFEECGLEDLELFGEAPRFFLDKVNEFVVFTELL